MNSHKTDLIRAVIERIKRLFKRKPDVPEDDPYVYVTAPKKPRPPYRSAAAVAEWPED
jgi:hypothetical protein